MSIFCLFVIDFSPALLSVRLKNYLVLPLTIHFSLNIYLICKWASINEGFSQYSLLIKLDQIANVNPQATIADGMGSLPRSNVLPLFLGLYDSTGQNYAEKVLKDSPPDLIFFTPKMSLSGTVYDLIKNSYVPIAPSIFTKRVLLPEDNIIKIQTIMNSLTTVFKFPIHTVSFRIYKSENENSVIEATCSSTFVTKKQWRVSELADCSSLFFKNRPQNLAGEFYQIYSVPWPAFEKSWSESLSRQLNYKNHLNP